MCLYQSLVLYQWDKEYNQNKQIQPFHLLNLMQYEIGSTKYIDKYQTDNKGNIVKLSLDLINR